MQLPWLDPGEEFPDVGLALDHRHSAPGLLAAGGALDVETLQKAYARGIFPWFSEGQPILWWSPNPRMVLRPQAFKLHRSLLKTIARFRTNSACEIRVDHSFGQVISNCAASPREGQSGTWIVPSMVSAYEALHEAGVAHSVETWIDGQLVGGLYCVALGRAVFGESMFTRVPNASKIALAALVALCKAQGVPMIDCQQNTAHLARLGASEIARSEFVTQVALAVRLAPLSWQFAPLYWDKLSPRLASA